MDLAVRASLFFRSAFRHTHGVFYCALLTFALLELGTPQNTLVWWALGVAGAVLLGTRGVWLVRRRADALLPKWWIGETAVLLIAAVYVAITASGQNVDGPFSAVLYAILAVASVFVGGVECAWMVVLAITLDLVVRTRSATGMHGPLASPSVDMFAWATRSLLMIGFCMFHSILFRGELKRIRTSSRSRLETELLKLREDARSYRLLGSSESAGKAEKAEEKLTRASVEEIHESVLYALDLLRRSLDLHTAILLWLNDAGSHFRISEVSTSTDELCDTPIPIGDGILGAVHSEKRRVTLSNLGPSFHVPYYAGSNPARELCAIPVVEEDRVRGILIVDRSKPSPFSQAEEELIAKAAAYCQRAIQNERVFVQLERAKVEQGKLYRAVQALQSAFTERDVLDACVRSAREIASFDLAAVTIYNEETKSHQVVAGMSSDKSIEDLVGSHFASNTGLVSMVVRNRFPLPYRGEFDRAHQVVLTKRFPWPDVPSLLVLPLVHRDRVLGTLILGSKRRLAFGDSVRGALEVLATHLAVSLSNARMVQKLETMATTDGLTGLLNKRAMLDAASQKIASAARFSRKLSVLVTDIDHFKKVNDTHGHAVGDVVIKGLGEILKRQKRGTDIVARFGGEEFVVVCEETDEAGAHLLAERIREELERTEFQCPQGTFRVTCSLGIATYGEAGRSWDELFHAADEALYVSKKAGRNKTTAWQPVRVKMSEPPVSGTQPSYSAKPPQALGSSPGLPSSSSKTPGSSKAKVRPKVA